MCYLKNYLRNSIQGALLIGCFCLGSATDLMAAGWYNMPTSLPQCLGYGYGPGYHSPMILGPRLAAGVEAKRVVYVPRAPISQPCGNSFGESSCIDLGSGSTNHFDGDQYHQAMPTMAPTDYMSSASQPVLAPPANYGGPLPTLTAPSPQQVPSIRMAPAREARSPQTTSGPRPWHR